jgi:hypothetical protein
VKSQAIEEMTRGLQENSSSCTFAQLPAKENVQWGREGGGEDTEKNAEELTLHVNRMEINIDRQKSKLQKTNSYGYIVMATRKTITGQTENNRNCFLERLGAMSKKPRSLTQ